MEYIETVEVLAMRIGTGEMVLLVILALLVFGGNRISGLGKALGTSIREFKKETENLDSGNEAKIKKTSGPDVEAND